MRCEEAQRLLLPTIREVWLDWTWRAWRGAHALVRFNPCGGLERDLTDAPSNGIRGVTKGNWKLKISIESNQYSRRLAVRC